ncbi:hypothetical protein C7S18_15800 [Ahniella affigens]|uniref:Peptidase S8/S53 domain-containing protein n=1 Tax=Ahniella affigens TaxID=2021234 RepID=A0A2P1PUP1_9GAMM|nr:S8 family serine peptidase [Ahniella affigens]AVP98559.1 hypothetical protein C7S18_15800 [Ahniella affigens]
MAQLNSKYPALLAAILVAVFPGASHAQSLRGFQFDQPEDSATSTETMQRLIMKVSPAANDSDKQKQQTPQQKLNTLGAATGTTLTYIRALSAGAWLVEVPQTQSRQAMESLSDNLMAADPSVLFAHPDYRIVQSALPNDPSFSQQWHYQVPSSTNRSAVNLPSAWNVSEGLGVTVAVIDSGYRPHVDLIGNIAPGGYDFVSIGDNDSSPGWDNDPLDTVGTPAFCNPRCAWHGTHVAGTVAAVTNNGIGVAGVAPRAKVLPVRVNTPYSGQLSDLTEAIYWTAGLTVPGLPGQALPRAQVINMSLNTTSQTGCPAQLSNAITAALTRNVVVVVSAGNNDEVANYPPANCPGVITVAGLKRDGGKYSASNYGPNVTISAPAGQSADSSSSVYSTYNDGLGVPGADSYRFLAGTSMAAPHVAGVAALLKSMVPNATPEQIEQYITSSARPFTSSSCTTSRCGAGMLDANAAVLQAQSSQGLVLNPILSGVYYDPTTAGQGVMIDVDPNAGVVFMGWYTFAHEGGNLASKQRWFTAVSAFVPGSRSAQMTIYQNIGGNFDNLPTTSASPVGSATLTFQSCNVGTLDYTITFDGITKSGSVPLTRITTSEYCQTGAIPAVSLSASGINPTLDGSWYEPRTSGQGMQFVFAPQNSNTAFLTWYTYDINGQNAGTSGQRWYAIQGSYTPGAQQVQGLAIYESIGGRFDGLPRALPPVQVGTADLAFQGCNQATLTYNIAGRPSRTIPLTRLSGGGACSP